MPATPSPSSSLAPEGTRSRGPGGVFWRTFLLIAILIGASLAAWYQSFRVLERAPRAQQAAQLIVSIVNLTRSALIHSDPEKRRALLIDLAQNEGVRIYPLEPTDQTAPLPNQAFLQIIDEQVRARLGQNTQMTLDVNGQRGLWVSFFIEDDGYWVAFDPSRLDTIPRMQWVGWGAVALALSLLGAVVISRLINLPLKRIATAAVSIGRGTRPEVLPEKGPREIRQANASFNAMVAELERIEADRALLLAGISHDLRTPLTRLRLEIEMSPVSEEARAAMSTDVEQIDAIIGQFLDYARPLNERSALSRVDLALLVEGIVSSHADEEHMRISLQRESDAMVRGNPTELQRILLNLIENARRYGVTPGTDVSELEVTVKGGATPTLEVRDHGPGIPVDELERLKRPFTRRDTARGQTDGAGLGLAIIERIARRHHARFDLLIPAGGGLLARITFPKFPST